ncbi:MAG: HAMP domain-containing histidine kinase [Burkholderiales bacterium]|nr:HAMP domain-containing histidine kinase [Burkholderiales bacterium]
MNVTNLSRTTTFRLTLVYSIFFTVCVITVLGFIYWKTAREMTSRVDQILRIEREDFSRTGNVEERVGERIRRDQRHIYFYGLFSPDGKRIAGNVSRLPSIAWDGSIHQVDLPPHSSVARVMILRMKGGNGLLLGHDVQQLVEFRENMKNAFFWGGSLTVFLGLAFGIALSLRPLHRIEEIQRVCEMIMRGDIRQRLPITSRRDELDMLTATVNTMLDEIERLMSEVKSVCDNIAHDLRTPLTRLRARIYRLGQQLGETRSPVVEQLISEMDSLLQRFRALLRISEIENKQRRSGFKTVSLADILEQAVAFFEPLAETKSIDLAMVAEYPGTVQGDGELLFEAIVNLLDNAIKFTPAGGKVVAKLSSGSSGPRIDIVDTGEGIDASERSAVLNRFYRGKSEQQTPGFGLGLSIVTAIVRLHDFGFELGDAEGGTRATIFCYPPSLQRFVE